MSESYTALELASGIGGMALALRAAGFQSHGADVNKKAVHVANLNGLHTTEMDLFDPEIVDRLRATNPSPDLIHGPFPCQGFSQASFARDLHKQMCNSVTTRSVDVMIQMKPRVITLENVLHARNSPTWQSAIVRLNQHGYHTAQVQLDACRLGVPQSRKRLFVAGVLSNGDDLTAVQHLQAYISTCKEKMREGEVTTTEDALPDMKGERFFFYPRRRENQSVFSSNRPVPTIRSTCLAPPSPSVLESESNAGPIFEAIRPTKELILRLCGFPADFQLTDERTSTGTRLGNCVCPPMGRFVADFVRSLIPMAGDGSTAGISLIAKYAIRPLRFRGTPRGVPLNEESA